MGIIMPQIDLISNDQGRILDFIRHGLRSSTNFDWASAYATKSAYRLIEDEFRDFLKRGGRSRVVFDLAQGLTDPEVIEEMSTIPGDSVCKVFAGHNTTNGIFHHKFYNFYSEESAWLMVGSANFTESGLTQNMESSLAITYDIDDELYSNASSFFEDSIWLRPGTVSPLGYPDLLDAYREYYDLRQRFQSDLDKPFSSLSKKIFEHYQYTSDFSLFNPFIGYLCGIICANSKYNSLESVYKERTINLRFRSALHNRDSKDEGYICTRMNGELLGDIRLEQIPIQVKSMRDLAHDLETQMKFDSPDNRVNVEDRSNKDTNVYLNLTLAEDSQIWRHVIDCLNQFGVGSNNQLIPSIPRQVLESKDPEIWRGFIKGYFDFRVSPTKGHALPNGILRIGVDIDTLALTFAQDLRILLDKLAVTTDFNSGFNRNRNHIIRIHTNSNSNTLFDRGWKRLMAEEYDQFNRNLR